MSNNPVIAADGLTHYYGDTVGVEDLDLEVHAGEVFGFLGPNGSGKTTTIRLLLDFLRPTRGAARLFGVPASDAATRARVGYLPGELFLDGRMTGHATLRFLDALLPPERRAREQRRAVLADRLGLAPRDLRRRVREYSRGMKQRLALISAFQHDPELLILDEPTEGLDPMVRETLFDLMREASARGATVFHSSHVLSEVDRTCDRVAILRRGRLVTVMDVAEARARAARRMVVEFEGDVVAQDFASDGVEVLESDGRRLVLRVTGTPQPLFARLGTGTPQPLFARLGQQRLSYMSFPESTMEEAFARIYGDEGAATTSRTVADNAAETTSHTTRDADSETMSHTARDADWETTS
jgi:ABC-2 type transport system ATP-binding protein